MLSLSLPFDSMSSGVAKLVSMLRISSAVFQAAYQPVGLFFCSKLNIQDENIILSYD